MEAKRAQKDKKGTGRAVAFATGLSADHRIADVASWL